MEGRGGGSGNRFVAATGGIEYTLYQMFSGNSDLGLLAEVMADLGFKRRGNSITGAIISAIKRARS